MKRGDEEERGKRGRQQTRKSNSSQGECDGGKDGRRAGRKEEYLAPN